MTSKPTNIEDIDVEPESKDGPLWEDQAILEYLLVDCGMSYTEVADLFDMGSGGGPSRSKIGELAREYELNRGREGSVYETVDAVPVRSERDHNQEDRINRVVLPISDSLGRDLDILNEEAESAGDTVKGAKVLCFIYFDDGVPKLHMDFSPTHFDLELSPVNEQSIIRRKFNRYANAPIPMASARMLGLDRDGGGDFVLPPKVSEDSVLGRLAHLTQISSHTVLASFEPKCHFDVMEGDDLSPPKMDDGLPLERLAGSGEGGQSRRLKPVKEGHKELTPGDVMSHQLYLPSSYVDAYGFAGGNDVRITLGRILEPGYEDLPAIIVHKDGDSSKPGLLRPISRYSNSDDGDNDGEAISDNRLALYPPMSLLHALGLALESGEGQYIDIDLIPGENWFAIVPAEDQRRYDPRAQSLDEFIAAGAE